MPRILVIDDDAGVRESFRAALEDAGYAVETVDDGRTGIESAKREAPDLVFLDLKMPGFTGVDTLRELHAAKPGLPVYLVTAFYSDYLTELRDLQSHGVDFNLARKPLTVREIQMIAASRLDQTSRQKANRWLDVSRVTR